MNNRLKPFLILTVCMLTVVLASCNKSEPSAASGPSASAGSASPSAPAKMKQWDKAPEMKIDTKKTYLAQVKTNKGNFTVELFAKDAPKTVNNFVFLAREGFYNNDPIFRISKNYMFQTGDPLGTGQGTPGYTFEDEKNNYKYELGTVAMANSGKNTNGSQFFVVTGPEAAFLNTQPNYTIFGKVTEGLETVAKINETPAEVDPKSNDGKQGIPSKPKEKVAIESVTITEKK